MTAEQRVVLVTGTSSGIGAATRTALAVAGWRAFGSSRHADGSDPDVLRLDVTDDDSVHDGVATLLRRTGRIDAVVNNAGVDIAGAVEETTVAEAEALFAINVFGVHRVTRAVLPHLRQQGGGRIVVVGSLSGLVPVPFDACYTAAKHALEGWIEALQFEVAPFGVRCTIVEPGFVRTSLRDRKQTTATRLAVYAEARRRIETSFDRAVAAGVPPEHVAQAITKILESRRPPLHRKVGSDARRTAALRAVLPSALFQAGMRRRF